MASARWLEPADAEWHATLKLLDHDVYHLPGWSIAESRLVDGTPRAFLFEDGADLFFVPLVFRTIRTVEAVDATSTFGYPGPLTNITDPKTLGYALDRFTDGLRDLRTISAFIRMHPVVGVPPEALADRGTLVQHGETVAIDLTQTEEEIWRWVKRDHRQDINRAKRAGMTARIDQSWEHIGDFLAIYQATMDRVHAAGNYYFPAEYFFEMRERLGDHMQLWLVESDDEIASAGLFTQVDGIVQFHLSGTADGHLRLSPSKLMIDAVWRWAREADLRVFHLGGGVEAAHDSLFEFKSRFSNWRLPFYTWRLVVNEEHYTTLTDRFATGEKPGYFPAYRS